MRGWMADLGAHWLDWLVRWSSLATTTVMAKSPEVKLAVFGRAGVGKSGKQLCACVCSYSDFDILKVVSVIISRISLWLGLLHVFWTDLCCLKAKPINLFGCQVAAQFTEGASASFLSRLTPVPCFLMFSSIFLSVSLHSVISPHAQFDCIANVTVGGCFWSGANTFTPTDNSVESLSFVFSIPLWTAAARPQLAPLYVFSGSKYNNTDHMSAVSWKSRRITLV